MNIKKLNEELNTLCEMEYINKVKLDDLVDGESTVRDYIVARTEHIEQSIHDLAEKFPEIKDTYEWEDIDNQIFGLYELMK